MADQTITQSEIASLAAKLDEIADVLTDKEKALLLGVFRLAGQALSAHVSTSSDGQQESGSGGGGLATGSSVARVGSLSSGFKSAFSPLGQASLNVRTGLGNVASGVGIGVVW